MEEKIFDIRPLSETDYDTYLTKWWNDWGWEPPTKDFLPQDGTGGMMVLDEGTPICAGFVYFTNSKAAWVDWIISNKEYRKKPERTNAIGLLIETLTNICRNKGAKYCYALIKHKGLIETYKELGYTQGGSYTSEMIKKL
jgi:hypothetical protein